MPQNIQYAETTVDKVIKFLKGDNGSLTGFFKSFYYGDPLKIPLSSLPAVVVQLAQTNIGAGPTGMDEIEEKIVIVLMYNKRNDFGKSDKESSAIRTLEEFAQGVNPTTSLYDANSILGILRTQFTLNNYIFNQNVSIDYEPGIRPDDLLTGEARITFTVKRHIEVAPRT
jgi:hypothetical protein